MALCLAEPGLFDKPALEACQGRRGQVARVRHQHVPLTQFSPPRPGRRRPTRRQLFLNVALEGQGHVKAGLYRFNQQCERPIMAENDTHVDLYRAKDRVLQGMIKTI